MTFLNQIEEEVEAIKKQLTYKRYYPPGAIESRSAPALPDILEVIVQNTGDETYTPPGRIRILPVEYQEP